jgi:lipopolysaccharide/colanic/teichoic acid biosynthesis glycosyltransferase
VWEYLWDLPNHALYFLAKRCLDICLSAAALLLLSPLLLVLASLIKLADGGPILSWSMVAGRDGVPLRLPRFRTTIRQVDSSAVTRIGRVLRRAGLDNLPQLWLVVRGQMTLVGPESLPLADLARWGAFAQMRQCVPPGLTGLAQIRGPAGSTFDERMYLDREYLLTCSMRRDLLILLGSLPAALRLSRPGGAREMSEREVVRELPTPSDAAHSPKEVIYADS